jgi:hypothetical protein
MLSRGRCVLVWPGPVSWTGESLHRQTSVRACSSAPCTEAFSYLSFILLTNSIFLLVLQSHDQIHLHFARCYSVAADWFLSNPPLPSLLVSRSRCSYRHKQTNHRHCLAVPLRRHELDRAWPWGYFFLAPGPFFPLILSSC